MCRRSVCSVLYNAQGTQGKRTSHRLCCFLSTLHSRRDRSLEMALPRLDQEDRALVRDSVLLEDSILCLLNAEDGGIAGCHQVV
jgi:hypothetical protein